ncbi:Rieske 2Fe-2S domain-containing protein [Dongia sp.]|uniref:Rieske 2Fe-2S domain-containing protein n=1 Tax=Dongia sp. TaxID=1977262 RepID=UPI0035AF3821
MTAGTGYLFVELGRGQREIWCGETRAFLLSAPGAAPAIVPGRCPHRGGPLALGHYDCRDRQWHCPWHGQKHDLASLRRRALPAIRRGADWLVVLPAGAKADLPVCLARIHLARTGLT